jgi:hypothetical protein
MIADGTGSFFGTTVFGGVGGGTVFKLTPSGSGYTESVLYNFQGGTDGSDPEGVVLRDGALYGVTFIGGDPSGNGGIGWGTVFKLMPGKHGYRETVLYRFRGGADAWEPNAPIVFDKNGSMYGSAGFGGSRNAGAVFKVSPSTSGYTESVVYSFPGGAGGELPEAGLTIDTHGAIYGTTMYGGYMQGTCGSDGGCGTVFKLAPGKSGYSESVIYAFTGGSDGNLPDGTVTVDERAGTAFGTTYWGGTKRVGTVFKLTPRGKSYTESVLHSFNGTGDGFLPEGTLLLDAGGTLYGTTRSGGRQMNCADGGPGGARGCGVVFKIVTS